MPPPLRLPRPGSTATTRRLVLLLALSLGACASQAPVVYSRASDSIVMNERTRRDVADCARLADARVGRNGMTAASVSSKSAGAGAVGFVATAVGSAVSSSKSAWERARVAAAGGAAGMATKLLLEWNEPDEVYQGYVERCLENRGHDVLGWR
jgi:predicted lipoprotein